MQHTPVNVTPAPNMREWAELTGTEFAALDRANTPVLVSCSPLEVHGPHLPVVTDNLEAEALCYRAAALFHEIHPEVQILHMPPIYVATDVIPHAGSVMFRSSTIIRVLEDLGRSLARQGFRHIWVASFHGGPRHFVSIETAADRVNRRYGARMVSLFSLLVKRLTGGESHLAKFFADIQGLDVSDLQGDSHAGVVETSILLHLVPDLVARTYRNLPQRTVTLKLQEQGLPPIESDKPTVRSLMRGFKHKLKYYETETYAGRPAVATPAIGEEMLDRLAAQAAEACGELWTGKLDLGDCRSPLWPVRWIFTSRVATKLFESILRYKNPVF